MYAIIYADDIKANRGSAQVIEFWMCSSEFFFTVLRE